MIKSIPLNKLLPSPRNVRRTTDEQADLRLKADIESRGLLQNLIVTSATKPRGSFAVEAGGRRLTALKALLDEGKLPPAHEVSCLVLDTGPLALEASLAENFQRLSMNPADECLAFRKLTEEGADAEAIARRFGLTVRFVEGRLRLAALAPVVFAALGAGEISLDVAKAYAATPDHERQALVFEQMTRGYGSAYPDSIRRMMTQATIGAGDRRARFVGEDAYLAAGGRIERDLFSDDDAARWLDIAIVERLACEKLEAEAVRVAGELGYAFIRPSLNSWIGHDDIRGLRRVPLETAPLTQEETERLDALEGDIENLVMLLQDEDTEPRARDEAEEKVRALNDQIDAIVNKPPVVDDDLKPTVGAFLVLDQLGRPRLDPHLYIQAAPGEAEGEGDANARSPEPTARPSRAAGLPQRLVDELAMQRRDILAVHVAADPALALDLATFLMIDREAGYDFGKSGSSLTAAPPANPVFDFKTPDARATIARREANDALDRSWLEADPREARFDAFRALPAGARAAWLGHAIGATLEASVSLPGPRACDFHDHLARLIGIDVAAWWRPTGANFFDRVPKAVALAALEDIGGESLAARYAKAKKAELAEACERIFAGEVLAAEVRQAALAWVPPAMRFVPAVAISDPGNSEPLPEPGETLKAAADEPTVAAIEEAA